MNKIAHFIQKYSVPIITVVLIITIFFGYFATKIGIKAGIKDMLPDDNPVVMTYEDVSDTFGGMTYAVIMLQADNILEKSTLQKIDFLTAELEALQGVDSVESLTNIKEINGSFMGIEVDEIIKDLPETQSDLEKLKEKLLKEDQYRGKIYTEDFTSTILLVNLEDEDDLEGLIKKIKEIAYRYEGPESVYLTGSPVMVDDATDYMKNDLAKLVPYIVGIIILILMISFRSLRGVVLPLATVLISVIWAVGIQQLMGKSLSLVSTVLPVLLVSVGSAYAIHIVARYYEELHTGSDVKEAVSNTIKKVGIAVIMAGGTTMIGFASLFFSELTIIQDFALATAFGIGVSLLISLFFVPAVLLHLKRPKQLKAAEERAFSTNFFKGISHLVFNRRRLIILFVIILIIGSGVVIPKLKPETNYISYFKKGNETRVATELVDQLFGGSQPVNVVINGSIKDPDLLKRMRDFQDEVEKIDHVNNLLSMVNIFREENMALNNDDESMKVIPTNKKQIAQYLLLMEMSDKEMLEHFLTFDYNTTRIMMTIETLSSLEQREILNQIQGLIDKHFGDKYQVELTGIPSLADEVTSMVVAGQLKSLISSILFTFIMTSLMLKSIKRGFFCSLPIALTVLINFGIMGWLNISLDAATVMIASVAVGIGVDYSIHIFTRYLEEKENMNDPIEALKTSIFTVGRANFYNAVAVIAGFCVILFSSFPPLVCFGGLTAVTMVVSFFGALLILPSLIASTIKIRNKVKEKLSLS